MLHLSPWPWYVVGPLIVITMANLLLVGTRFGLSSNIQTLCASAGANRLAEYFEIDWLSRSWNLVFVAGTIAGGAVARYLLLGDHAVALNPTTVESLQSMGITDAGAAFAPAALFSSKAWTHPVAIAMLLVGGMLVGLGTRWANGCTSGHAISGLSAMQWPSLLGIIGFFIADWPCPTCPPPCSRSCHDPHLPARPLVWDHPHHGRSHQLVPHSGDVPVRILPHVWGHRKRRRIGCCLSPLARRFQWETTEGGDLDIYRYPATQWKAYFIGGIVFGMGWAITGACPGPLFITVGAGYWPI